MYFKGEKLGQFMIVCLQCGICLTYFIFAAKNVIDVASYFNVNVSLRYEKKHMDLKSIPTLNVYVFTCTTLMHIKQ
jgi:translation initiation factor RLI1